MADNVKGFLLVATIFAWVLCAVCLACAIAAWVAGQTVTGTLDIMFAGVVAANAIGIGVSRRKATDENA